MDVERLQTAIDKVRGRTPESHSRAATYMRTYPALLAAARCVSLADTAKFLQLATMVYGWMPRILVVDPTYLDNAVRAVRRAPAAAESPWGAELVDYVAACLHSVVGASKLLHFANPAVFPIWDSNVERIRLRHKPSADHMGKTKNYASYAQQVHEIRRASSFREFYEAFNQAYQERLDRLGISRYQLTEVRAIEAAAFELASDEEQGDAGPGHAPERQEAGAR